MCLGGHLHTACSSEAKDLDQDKIGEILDLALGQKPELDCSIGSIVEGYHLHVGTLLTNDHQLLQEEGDDL